MPQLKIIVHPAEGTVTPPNNTHFELNHFGPLLGLLLGVFFSALKLSRLIVSSRKVSFGLTNPWGQQWSVAGFSWFPSPHFRRKRKWVGIVKYRQIYEHFKFPSPQRMREVKEERKNDIKKRKSSHPELWSGVHNSRFMITQLLIYVYIFRVCSILFG